MPLGEMVRYDIVVYGATGFTGAYILRALVTSALFKDKTLAVAGRSKDKLQAVLKEIAEETGLADVCRIPVIIADSSNDETLAAMATQANVIINAVGPYILYGEAVVNAAVENGACHIDISGEPLFLERMVHKYDNAAREKGVYVVGACGFDSIPCDLGTEFIKQHFDGTLAFVETFVRLNKGPAGYPLNTGTYESMLLAIASFFNSEAHSVHRAIEPKKMPSPKYTTPWRQVIDQRKFPLTQLCHRALSTWAIPFMGADKSIVDRSQYYDYHVNGKPPVQISTYMAQDSLLKCVLALLWLGFVGFFALFTPTRKLMQAHPEIYSFGMFQRSGPSKQQIHEASLDYFVFGTGWAKDEKVEGCKPTKKTTAICHAPDAAYVATSACISSVALALLNDREQLPKNGGVYTTASALRATRIYEYLRTMGVTFTMENS